MFNKSDNYITLKKLLKKGWKSTYFKWTYGHFGNDFRVAALSKFITPTGNWNHQTMIEIERTILTWQTLEKRKSLFFNKI